jgi:hypothetical protein
MPIKIPKEIRKRILARYLIDRSRAFADHRCYRSQLLSFEIVSGRNYCFAGILKICCLLLEGSTNVDNTTCQTEKVHFQILHSHRGQFSRLC